MKRSILALLAVALFGSQAFAQFACEDTRITPASPFSSLDFGLAVACDGTWLFATAKDLANNGVGTILVFRRSQFGTWIPNGQLPTPSAVFQGDLYGTKIDLWQDRVVVSAPNHDANGKDTGAVWIFERKPGGWTQVAKFVGPALVTGTAPSPRFGTSLDLEGDLLAVGAPGHTQATLNGQGQIVSTTSTGAAFVYRRNAAGTWSLDESFFPAQPFAAEGFGYGVALEGDLVHIGVPGRAVGGSVPGTVEVFQRVGAGPWPKVATLLPPQFQTGMQFGRTVAADQTCVAVAALQQSRVYTYERVTTTAFQFQQVLAPVFSPFVLTDDFGIELALRGDALLVGSPEHDQGALDPFDEGVVYLFERADGEPWFPSLAFASSRFGDEEEVGAALALTDSEIVIGAPRANDAQPLGGAVLTARRGSLYHDLTEDSTVFPRTQTLFLRAGPEWKNAYYVVLGSLSGTSPGIEIAPGTFLPLVYDAYTQLTLDLLAPLDDPFDVLKSNGDREARFVTPTGLFPTYTGLEFDHVFVAVHPVTYELFVSNTVHLRLLP